MAWLSSLMCRRNRQFVVAAAGLCIVAVTLLAAGCGAGKKAPQFIGTITPAGDEALHSAEGLFFSSKGNLIIADSWQNRIVKMRPKTDAGQPLEIFINAAGTEPGALSVPSDVVADALGNLYVTDCWNHRVQKFSKEGELLASWGKKSDIWNLQNDELFYPKGIAMDPEGNIYVADSADHRVVKYSPQGETLLAIGDGQARKQPGFFNTPLDVACDLKGNLYVTDAYNSRIQKFSKDGKVIDRWGEKEGKNPGQFNRPSGIAIDPENRVYVVDSRNHRIQVFDESGGLIAVFGERGSGPGQFESPESITCGLDGKIYVLDWGNNRIQVFSF